jgi:hypothetical protein
MAQFEGETDVEYLGRCLRVLRDVGVNLTADDIVEGFKVYEAPRGNVDAVVERIERVARRRSR